MVAEATSHSLTSYYKEETCSVLGWLSALLDPTRAHSTMKSHTLEAGGPVGLCAVPINPGESVLPSSLMRPIFFLALPPFFIMKSIVRKYMWAKSYTHLTLDR